MSKPQPTTHQLEQLSIATSERVGILTGAAGCLHPDTKIYDPVECTYVSVRDRRIQGGSFHVYALDDNGEVIVATADCPRTFTREPMYEFVFESGAAISVTARHRFWDGVSYSFAADVASLHQKGVPVLLPRYSLASRSVHASGGVRSTRTVQGCPGRYSGGRNLCDAQPHAALNIDRSCFPSQVCVLRHTHAMSQAGDLACRYIDSRPRQLTRHSKMDCFRLIGPRFACEYERLVRVEHLLGEFDLCLSGMPHMQVNALLNKAARHGRLSSSARTFAQHISAYVSFAETRGSHSDENESSFVTSGTSRQAASESFRTDSLRKCQVEFPCFTQSCSGRRSAEDTGYDRLIEVNYVGDDVYFDFTVPVHHNYWCEGFFHHNTGKSFTTSHFLNSLKGGYRVAAPTGKAAARLQQEGIPATTVHSMLCPERGGHDGDGWSFTYNEHFPLPANVVVVDEAFMLGTEICRDLISAVSPGTNLLFTGDPNQLAPVGHGRPVFDMLESGCVPHGHLSEVHRFAGRIARVANAIKDGKPWAPSKELDLSAAAPENLRHIEAPNDLMLKKTLPVLIDRMKQRGFDPISDIQVICGLNDKGTLCRKRLNPELQSLLNQNDRIPDFPYRVGDKVMCLKNQWRKAIDGDGDEDELVYIANGEIGIVKVVVFSKHDKPIAVIVDFNGCRVKIEKVSFSQFDLAYACTCHKLQGSQSPVVIVLADDGAAQVASRSWWYTALTRASQVCLILGKKSTVVTQCARVDLQRRKTFLKEQIQEWSQRGTRSEKAVVDDSFLEDL